MTAPHSALEPAGIQARHAADLFWLFTGVSALVFLLVTLAFVIALVRRKDDEAKDQRELSSGARRRRHRAVAIAVGVTTSVLVFLLVASARTTRALAALSAKDAIPIEVVAHEWWWEMRYPAQVAGLQLTTAYEMHVPVGRNVEVRLQAVDVIHSFWAPSLHVKRDAIPGKRSSFVLRADEPGRYEGMCAEFCGLQHANMRFVVVAESEDDFRRWLEDTQRPAAAPVDPLAMRGRDVFAQSRCSACHAVLGTAAAGRIGPDLTHVASRSGLAMGTIPNTRGHLAGWIVDPQSTKPGTTMPATPLPPEDLLALLAYLEGLR